MEEVDALPVVAEGQGGQKANDPVIMPDYSHDFRSDLPQCGRSNSKPQSDRLLDWGG